LTGRIAAAVLPLILAVAPAEAAKQSDEPRIEALEVERLDDRVVVSFRVTNGLTADALDRIRSGLPVAQRHKVEVVGRRAVSLWPAKVYRRLRIDTAAVFDSLTRRYELTRKIEVLPRKKKQPPVLAEEHHATDSIEEVRSWMTEFQELPTIELPASALTSRLRVRVESMLGRRFVFYMFPARLKVSAEHNLEP
jgi:hypothetical protein